MTGKPHVGFDHRSSNRIDDPPILKPAAVQCNEIMCVDAVLVFSAVEPRQIFATSR